MEGRPAVLRAGHTQFGIFEGNLRFVLLFLKSLVRATHCKDFSVGFLVFILLYEVMRMGCTQIGILTGFTVFMSPWCWLHTIENRAPNLGMSQAKILTFL